jgi:hypothetical protein
VAKRFAEIEKALKPRKKEEKEKEEGTGDVDSNSYDK